MGGSLMKIDEVLLTSVAEKIYSLGGLNNPEQDNDLTREEAQYYARAVIQYLTTVNRLKPQLTRTKISDSLREGGYVHPARAKIYTEIDADKLRQEGAVNALLNAANDPDERYSLRVRRSLAKRAGEIQSHA